MTPTATATWSSRQPSAGRSDAARSGSSEAATLGQRLRAETKAAHVEAERAFDLERRLGTLGDYGDALLVLDAWARACAPTLEALAPALAAPLRDGPARRSARLTADLAQLERVSTAAATPLLAADPDRALGAWYVHEGAALGGLLIAAEVRRRLPAAAAATRFFAGEGRGTARRWRCFQDVLAAWAPGDVAAADRVVAGARATFAAFTVALADLSAGSAGLDGVRTRSLGEAPA